ncbi:MAG: phosphodiester glycosidase family protein, partial [Dictyoglomus sp.]
NIDGTIIPVNAINSPRGVDNVVIFTKYYGKETQIRENASAGIDIEIILENKIPSMGKTYGTVSNIYYGVRKTPIKENSCIISLGGTALRYLPYFSLGKRIEIVVECSPPILLKEAVSGGPILLRKGEIVLGKTEELPLDSNIINSKHPRTIVGIKNNTIYFLVIEGRKDNSQGVTLLEACNLLKELGVEEAINLDGGGSSQKLIWGKLVNQDLERQVPVGIGILNTYPYTEPKYLSFKEKDEIYLRKGEKTKVELILQDENFHTYTFSTQDLTWTSSNSNIYLDTNLMILEGKDIGESTLTIAWYDISASKKIYIWDYISLEIILEKEQIFLGDVISPKIFAIDNFQRKTHLSIDNLKFDPTFLKKEGTKLIAISPGKTSLEYQFNGLYYSMP